MTKTSRRNITHRIRRIHTAAPHHTRCRHRGTLHLLLNNIRRRRNPARITLRNSPRLCIHETNLPNPLMSHQPQKQHLIPPQRIHPSNILTSILPSSKRARLQPSTFLFNIIPHIRPPIEMNVWSILRFSPFPGFTCHHTIRRTNMTPKITRS
jgi:hypothetical protein